MLTNPYTVGRIRALENLTVTPNEMERILAAKDAESAFHVLSESSYSKFMNNESQVSNFQEILDRDMVETKALLDKITPEKHLLNVIWHQFDAHNLKTIIKGKLADLDQEEVEKHLSPLGALDTAKLKNYIIEEERHVNLEAWKPYIDSALSQEKPEQIDYIIDRAYNEIAFLIAKNSKNQFLLKFVRTNIDLSNLKLVIRAKKQEKDLNEIESALIPNGNIALHRLKDTYKDDFSQIADQFKLSDYSEILQKGIEELANEGTYTMLEKLSLDHLNSFLKRSKRMPFGPEAVLGFIWNKINNASIVRFILVGKLNNIDENVLRNKVRELYYG